MFGGNKKKKRKGGQAAGSGRNGAEGAEAAPPSAAGKTGAGGAANGGGPQPAGSQIGRYTVQSTLGQGGMGLVYLAHDPVIDRHVAIKVITARPETEDEARQYRERFLREAQAAGALIHPNIVAVHDIGQDPETGRPYIVMEHVEGQDLKKMIKASAPLPQDEAIRIALQIASALDFAHSRGIVHRDIKPANVLISERGQVKITDFGVARLPGSDLTQTDQMVGSPGFMSPEQLRGGAVDGRSDLFALGVILYQLLTGRSPFEGESVSEVLYKISTQPAEAPSEIHPDVSGDFDPILEKALNKNPDDRYATGREMIAALRGLSGESQGEAPAAPPLSSTGAAASFPSATPSSFAPVSEPDRDARTPLLSDETPAPRRRARRISPWLNPTHQWRLAFLIAALVTAFVGMNWAIHELFRGPLAKLAGAELEGRPVAVPGSPSALGAIGAPMPVGFGDAAPVAGRASGGRTPAGRRSLGARGLGSKIDASRRDVATASGSLALPGIESRVPIAPVCAMTYGNPAEIARVLTA
ncbi:MAG TPA: serine/threonine-protein kinase, partial [Candidatus Polarisedimenticolia bacterium]